MTTPPTPDPASISDVLAGLGVNVHRNAPDQARQALLAAERAGWIHLADMPVTDGHWLAAIGGRQVRLTSTEARTFVATLALTAGQTLPGPAAPGGELTLHPDEASDILSRTLGRPFGPRRVRTLLSNGQLRGTVEGRIRMVPASALHEYIITQTRSTVDSEGGGGDG